MRKIIAVLLAVSLFIGSAGNVTIKAEEITEDMDISVFTVYSEKTFQEGFDRMNDIQVIYTDDETFHELQIEEVKEVLDNGTDFLVANAEAEVFQEKFAAETIYEEDGQTVACYITAEDFDYVVMPVYADVLYEAEEIVSDEQYESDTMALYAYLIQNEIDKKKEGKKTQSNSQDFNQKEDFVETVDVSINPQEVYQIVHEQLQDEFLTQLSEKDLAKLQVSTLIGDAFCSNSKIVYFYKEGTANGTGTDYEYSSNTVNTGWSKMGRLNLGIYGLKVKTAGEVTYDNLYSVVTATGLNSKYVTKFRVNVGVTELTTNKIMHSSVLTSGNASTTGKLATGITNSTLNYTSYAMNPSGMTITTNFTESYKKAWTCVPASAKENESYKVRPGILLKKTNGTTSAVTGTVSIDYFQVSGGVRTYTIKDTVKCTIKIKNHTQV